MSAADRETEAGARPAGRLAAWPCGAADETCAARSSRATAAGVRHEEGRVLGCRWRHHAPRRSHEAVREPSRAGAPAGTCGTWSDGSSGRRHQVDVIGPQGEGLVDPQPGAGHEPDQGGVGSGTQAVDRGERPGRIDQRGDVGLGVQERRPAGMGRAEQPRGGTSVPGSRGTRYRASVLTTSSRRA